MLVFFRDFEILHTIFWIEATATNHRSRIRDENVNDQLYCDCCMGLSRERSYSLDKGRGLEEQLCKLKHRR
jgi:hypothetical protein